MTIPATAIGMLTAALWSVRGGKDLDKDEEFQERMKGPVVPGPTRRGATVLDQVVSTKAKLSVFVFLAGVLVIVLIAVLKLAPVIDKKPVSMTLIVQDRHAHDRCRHLNLYTCESSTDRSIIDFHWNDRCHCDHGYSVDERHIHRREQDDPGRADEGYGQPLLMAVCRVHVHRVPHLSKARLQRW